MFKDDCRSAIHEPYLRGNLSAGAEGKLLPPSGVGLPPVLDLLNVRYVILRGPPPPFMHPAFQSDDYWVLVNSNAQPRVFVPRMVKTVAAGQELEELASPQFNPADVALMISPVALPAQCRGTVQITSEIPTRIRVSAQMETPGLIVLADNWDKGWRPFGMAGQHPFSGWIIPSVASWCRPEPGPWNSSTDPPA